MNEESVRSTLGLIQQVVPERLYEMLLENAVRYAGIRAEWSVSDTNTRTLRDPERTRAHDLFIGVCNTLSQEFIKSNLSIEWREALGSDRRVIGDFACYIALILALEAR